MKYFFKAFQEFANFSGRARRKEYWMFVLISFLIAIGLAVISVNMGTEVLFNIYSLILFIPSISYAARRLHDTGRSGWWQLISIIPIIGIIILLFFLLQDSERYENNYGISPKYS